ncbi:MAG TPA: RNA-directed DNA polymerase [Beijerinckiaceae bacterium]
MRRLLESGYLPKELPPPFVSHDFGRFRKYLEKSWPADGLQFPKTIYENFSIPKFNGTRKKLAIINPTSYFLIAREIAYNWIEIKDHLRTSTISEFKPVFDTKGSRALYDIDFSHIEHRLAELHSVYPSVLRSDISRFFPSIYTHTIAWAMHGKLWCKQNLYNPVFKNSIGNRLDNFVRKGQDQQSIGIPIGPDTSRILGEIIGIGIEKELALALPQLDERALRYVDDVAIGFDSTESSEGIQAALMRSLAEFSLDINVEKTRVSGVGERLVPDWIHTLNSYSVSRRTKDKRTVIRSFFQNVLFLSQENDRDNVITYAVKRSRSFFIDDESWPYYESLLFRVIRKKSEAIPAVCQILIESKHKGRPVSLIKAEKFISDAIRAHAPLHHEMEVAWSLFLAKALRIQVKRNDLELVARMTSSVCALITLDLNSRALVETMPDITNWLSFANDAGLTSELWLFVYEATLKGWIQKQVPCFVENHALFGPMIKKKISFYDPDKNVSSTKKELRISRLELLRLHFMMRHIDEYF